MSGGTQCERFVRNAWKKDMCSNCFKGKEEHKEPQPPAERPHPKLPDPPKEGILRGSKAKQATKKSKKVFFPTSEFEVIGFGGEDTFSDPDDDELDFGERKVAEEPDTEQDREVQKITKINTDFNSVPSNLQGETPKQPVKLGKPLVDDQGQKKTLLVSVTPFAASPNTTIPRVKSKSTFEAKKTESEPKQTIETLEFKVEAQTNGNNLGPKVTEIGIKRSQPIDKNSNSKYRPNKENSDEVKNVNNCRGQLQTDGHRVNNENKVNEKLTASTKVATLLDKAKKKVHHLPVIGDPNNFKLKTIEYSAVANNKRPSIEVNTAVVVLDMHDLKNDSKEIEKPLPSDEQKISSAPTLATPTIVFERKKIETDSEKVTSISNLSRTPKPVYQVEIVESAEGKGTSEVEEKEAPKPNEDCSKEMNAQVEKTDLLCEKVSDYKGIIDGEEVVLFSKADLVLEEARPAPEGQADSVLCDGPPPYKAEVEEKDLGCDDSSGSGDEPPALPTSPPPAVDSHPQVSFLHQHCATAKLKLGEKPKVPVKPIVIPAKKPQFRAFLPRPKSPSRESFLDAPSTPPMHSALIEALTDSTKKRPAPKPPSPMHSSTSRATSSRLLRSALSSDSLLDKKADIQEVPEPVPRRSLSLSQDSLLESGVSEMTDKAKKSTRGRFFLRKLLHLGKSKEGSKESGRREYRIDCASPANTPPAPSPRLKSKPEIIHPSDLTGTRLEVVPPPPHSHRMPKSRRSSSSASSSSSELRESDIPSDSSASQSVSSSGQSTTEPQVSSVERARKPPPPPRGQSQDQTDKPARPPPPKSGNSPKRDSPHSTREPVPIPIDSDYANIGVARTGIAPSKPVRTGSLREVDVGKKLNVINGNANGNRESNEGKKAYWTGSLRGPPKCIPPAPEDSGYESFDVSLTSSGSQPSSQTSSLTTEENLYECVQAPGQFGFTPSDTTGPILRSGRQANYKVERRSEGSVPDNGQDYIKFRFLRSVSMPHCGSETDSEIYSPYSFCGSEMAEEDYEWSPTSGRFQKTSRLKMKKGRSIVHKNLEDNYGAVIIANHEALTQFVEQMHQGPVAPASLRPLSAADNLRWSDFTVVKDNSSVDVEQRAFYPALWGLCPVTLCLSQTQSVSSLHHKSPFNLNPLTEFHDLVPTCLLSGANQQDQSFIQCSISVLCRMQIETLHTYCRAAISNPVTEEAKKEIHFVFLQTINALKTLQAAGIEEAPRNLANMVVCREERDPHPRICILPGPVTESDSLCASLLTLLELLPPTELSPILCATLRAEKAVSLSQAKAILEYTLWGPADIEFGNGARSASLQRWLDLERASVLHGLVRTRADLTAFEEWHLLFLVHTNAKVLADASLLLDASPVDC